jgi:hypothetical protein
MDAPGEATGVQVRRLNRAGDALSRSDEEPARRFHRLHRMVGRLDTAAHRSGALVHALDRVVDRLCGAGHPMGAPVGRRGSAVRKLVVVADWSDVIDGLRDEAGRAYDEPCDARQLMSM